MLNIKKIEPQRKGMIAKELLYLTRDKKRVVTRAIDAAFLLARAGCEIPKTYEALVSEFYANQQKPKPEDLTQEDKEAPTTEATGPPGDPIENRETRIPKVLRKRGRPPKNA